MAVILASIARGGPTRMHRTWNVGDAITTDGG